MENILYKQKNPLKFIRGFLNDTICIVLVLVIDN